jgi:DNA-binding CsgD family transcriptional regulator
MNTRRGATSSAIETKKEASSLQISSPAGLILLDQRHQPVYYNAEALRILTYPGQLTSANGTGHLLPTEIRSLLLSLSSDQTCVTRLISGRRQYSCRAFAMSRSSDESARTVFGLLLERSTPKPVDISRAAAQFHLTHREQETVGLLTLGLTSKEIAGRMNVSHNTVRAFVRLIMAKMAVSTRSGIVGKIAAT